ncbi:MAG TPA: DNA ligase D [Terricaulis sp.]|nr:DNA ligase D [Terricaulis sp.]
MARKTSNTPAAIVGDLSEYKRKRDFKRTSEPAPGAAKSAGGMFVVQKHAASRLHYDFRLEHKGVLMSWAVPQGPSLDPAIKRLAVRTENHPIEYGGFEGVIPKGEYGAGAVIIWDDGKVRWLLDPDEGMAKGELKFVLAGARLQGEFHLVKIKPREGERGEPWLLFKSKDAYASADDPLRAVTSVKTGRTVEDLKAKGGRVWSKGAERAAARPATLEFVEPALCSPIETPPSGDGWLHEIKYDGYRLQAAVNGPSVRLYTRTGLDWTARFGAIAQALGALNLKNALIDGEAAVADAQGRTDFGALQRALDDGKAKGVSYFAFDLLFDDGADLRKRPLTERKARLEALLKRARAPIRLSPVIEGNGPAVFEAFEAKGLEGVVSKRAEGAYRSGRTQSWLKAKCVNESEFVIIGYQPSLKGRAFAALMLAERVKGKLSYRGNVGTGFSDRTLASLSAQLAALARAKPALDVPRAAARGAKWVEPKLIAQVKYAELTNEGAVRHGVFLGLRGDKSPMDVNAETERPAPKSSIKLTNPGRVLFPDADITKAEYAAYLEAAATRIGAHVFGRPLSLVRTPDGVGGQQFFQKHAMAGAPQQIKTISISEAESGKAEDYLTVTDAAGLAACAQMSAVELHIWGSRNDKLDAPDRLVFDLDPDEGLAFEQVKRAAFDIKALLESAGLKSFAMITGGKGVHVVLHLKRRHDWDEVKGFARDFAVQVETLDPKRFVANMAKAKRKGRIFIDYLRNGRGATAIAPYSTRARPMAPIAVPVGWDELRTIPAANVFKLKDMPARLEAPDPWADYGESAMSLTKAARSKLGL